VLEPERERHRSPLVSRPTRWSVRSPPRRPACLASSTAPGHVQEHCSKARRHIADARNPEHQTVTPPSLREPRNRCAGLVVLVQKGGSRAERWPGPLPAPPGSKGSRRDRLGLRGNDGRWCTRRYERAGGRRQAGSTPATAGPGSLRGGMNPENRGLSRATVAHSRSC
jgi:hypothetical protein